MTKKFKLAAIAAACITTFNASAAIELYNDDGVTFSSDGLVNIFYSNSDTDTTDANGDVTNSKQSRVKTGFLPSYIGFNFAKELDELKVSTRSSFWVTLSDTDAFRDTSPADAGTGTAIDIRQFYATISGDFGEVLIGKDFGLFNRANIFGDELLTGYGQTSGGLADSGFVSFGNIATGYTYAFPKAQITYRSPEMSGFKLAIGVMDPNKVDANSNEESPRFEAELTYNTTFDDGSLKAWVSGVSQTSELAGVDQDQSGVGYGANVKFAGLSLTASGFSAEGIGGLDTMVSAETNESDGYLTQASYTMGDNRFVLSYGETTSDDGITETTNSNSNISYFRTVVPGVTVVFEYNKTENDNNQTSVAEENNVFSIGAVVTF
ncbi:MAG: porin [Colwellia sp.]|nr:MAG: porin [Colwellia sp.]